MPVFLPADFRAVRPTCRLFAGQRLFSPSTAGSAWIRPVADRLGIVSCSSSGTKTTGSSYRPETPHRRNSYNPPRSSGKRRRTIPLVNASPFLNCLYSRSPSDSLPEDPRPEFPECAYLWLWFGLPHDCVEG